MNLTSDCKDRFHGEEVQQEWLDTRQAAKYLGISIKNLRIKIYRGQISPQGKLGNRLKFKKQELDNFLRDGLLI